MKQKDQAKDILNSILFATQMGQMGIRSGLKASISPELRNIMVTQLKEYDAIERETCQIAERRRIRLKDADPGIRCLMNMSVKARIHGKNPSSKVAAMMVTGNTKGMIQSLQDQHRMPNQDSAVSGLAQKLLETEKANIRQAQRFL